MNDWTEQVRHVLSEHGELARAWPQFRPRPGQLAMAQAVAQTIETGGPLVVEAGTGVGKTFAYLVPVLLSRQRSLISTATKALQDQLFTRDLPRLAQVLGVPARVALLKGRSSYVCLHRAAGARQHALAQSPQSMQLLARVERWLPTTRTGDLSEVPGLEEGAALWPQLTSTRENCLGSHCPQHKACHVLLARREAMAADVVVVNHHLFFADLAVRESGVAELLPTVRVTVLDEAHQLCETGVQFLGQELASARLLELGRDILAATLQWARGLADWPALCQRLETSTRDWRLVAGPAPAHRGVRRLAWSEQAPQGLEREHWSQALQALGQALGALHQALQTVSELAPDLVRLAERVQAQQQLAQALAAPVAPEQVRWLEVGQGLRAVQAPLDVAQTLGPLTQPPAPLPVAEAAPAAPARAWIFTSATLGDEASLRWFTEPCGLQSAPTLRVDSPFDYPRQAGLYVPSDWPVLGSREHALAVAQLVQEAALTLGGRTLVLSTSLQAMRTIGEALQAQLGDQLAVLVQGQGPKRRLMERFRQGATAGAQGCVLVGSASFWEGFDVPGQALQLVVIDKLPFAPPDDPMHQARSERLKAQGKSPFAHLALPEAAVTLKQGAGRLVRSETDQGLLVVCDPRLLHSGYSRRLLAALPPMRRLADDQAYRQALQALVKPSPQLPPGLGLAGLQRSGEVG